MTDSEVPYLHLQEPNFSDTKREVTPDENDERTLIRVQKRLSNALYNLEHSFRGFSVMGPEGPTIAAENLLIDIQARQVAFHYLADVLAMVDSAVNRIKDKNLNE